MPLLQSIDGTDRQTDTRRLHRSCSTYFAQTMSIKASKQIKGCGCCCLQLDSSALLDSAVRIQPTSAEHEVKVSPTPVIKSKKTPSITSKLKSPAPVGRAKKLSLDKTAAEKGVALIWMRLLHLPLFAMMSYYFPYLVLYNLYQYYCSWSFLPYLFCLFP